MMTSQLAPYGVSHEDILHLSSSMLPPLQVRDKPPVSMDSNAGSETNKSEQCLLARVRSSSPNDPEEQKSLCQPVTAAPQHPSMHQSSHDCDQQPSAAVAGWAERLCNTTFFNPCSRHSSKVYRRCEVRQS